MSLGDRRVSQLLKEVAFRRILAFYNSRKWDHFVGLGEDSVRFWLGGGIGINLR